MSAGDLADKMYVAPSISLLSGIALSTFGATTGSRTNPSLLTILLALPSNPPISETMFLTCSAAERGLSSETFGICGFLESIKFPGMSPPVSGFPVTGFGCALPLAALRNAAAIILNGDGMSNSFAPHVDRRESVNRPPY